MGFHYPAHVEHVIYRFLFVFFTYRIQFFFAFSSL